MSRGLKAQILDVVKRHPSTVHDILTTVNDSALKEQYVKNILYRESREGRVSRQGITYTWIDNNSVNVPTKIHNNITIEKKTEELTTKSPIMFDSIASQLMYKCDYLYSNCEKVIKSLSLVELEEFHEEQLGKIPQEAKEYNLYIPTLIRRVWRQLERLIREYKGEKLSKTLIQRNSEWIDPPILDVLKEPPTCSTGLTWSTTATLHFPTQSTKTQGSGFKRKSKGFRGMILNCVKKRNCSVQDILDQINDSELKENYVKNILYRAVKSGQIENGGGTYKWLKKE